MRLREVLLGLVELHPGVSGYELRSIITRSTGYFVTASLSQIYPALKQLTEDGLVTFEVAELVGKQDRKMYTITPAGKKELVAALTRPLALPDSLSAFRDFLLGLTFMGGLDVDDIRSYVQQGLDHFRAEQRRTREDRLGAEREYLHLDTEARGRYLRIWEAEYDFLVADVDGKVRWIEELLASMTTPAADRDGGVAPD